MNHQYKTGELKAIVGGGLVGSLWALFLRKHGHEVQVFERRKRPSGGAYGEGRSINLVITSRGTAALKKVGLWDEAQKLCVPVYGRRMHDRQGNLSYHAYGRKEECNYSISRGKLNRLLIEAGEKQGIRFHFEHKLNQVDWESRVYTFETPQGLKEEKLGSVYGCDGAGSILRQQMVAAGRCEERFDLLSHSYKELLIPAGPGGSYQLEKNSLHIWPRGHHMLMALPNDDGSFTLTLYLPNHGPDSFDEIRTEWEVLEFFRKEYPDSIALIDDLGPSYVRNPTGALGTVRTRPWNVGEQALLLGDAAHAIVPFFGQGMNCGFEDCTTLDEIKGFEHFFETRKPDADAIADMALENFLEMRDKVGDQRFLMRKKVESLLEAEFPTEYRSRYAMVTYTHIPYSVAKKAGEIQGEILEDLTIGLSKAEEFDRAEASVLLKNKLAPFYRANGIVLGGSHG